MTDDRSVERPGIAEQIQRKVAHLVATLPVGVGLCLVGGFRYRLLDRGVRRSVDIDYHWAGDLEAKQRELIDLFTRRLDDLRKSTLRHAAAIDAVIQGQIDPASAATLADAGGGRAVLASVRGLLGDLLATSGKRS